MKKINSFKIELLLLYIIFWLNINIIKVDPIIIDLKNKKK